MEGVHAFFMNKRTIYIVAFNLSVYNSADKVAKWVSTIQAKVNISMLHSLRCLQTSFC